MIFNRLFVGGLFVVRFYNDLSGLNQEKTGWKKTGSQNRMEERADLGRSPVQMEKTGMNDGLPFVAADCRRLPPVAARCYRMMEERAKLFAALESRMKKYRQNYGKNAA